MDKASGDTIEKVMRQVALHPPDYQFFSPPVVRVATEHPTTNPLTGDLADNQRPQAPMIDNSQIDDMESRLNFPMDTLMEEAPATPKWSKPIKPWGTAYRSGEEEGGASHCTNLQHSKWGSDILPAGDEEFTLTSMEDGGRRVVSPTENWKADYLKESRVGVELLPMFAADLHPVDIWGSPEIPAIRPELIQIVNEYMRQQDTSPPRDQGVL